MRPHRLVIAALILAATAGCGDFDRKEVFRDPGSVSSTPSGREITSFADLAERPYTEEVTGYSGPALTFEDYKAQVNAICAELTAMATTDAPPTEEDGEAAVAQWAGDILDAGSEAYRKVASLRPPAEKEEEIRTEFLVPYFRQLRAAERLYAEYIAVRKKEGVESVLEEAQEAKRQRAIYAAKNDLTDCMG